MYIGQTQSVEERTKSHYRNAYNENSGVYNTRLSQAIREFGFENFELYLIDAIYGTIHNKWKANDLEMYYIDKFKTYLPYGLNITGTKGKELVEWRK